MIKPEHLKIIIETNQKIDNEINNLVEKDRAIYKYNGINIADRVSLIFDEKCELIQIPIKDLKIGGMIFKKRENCYCLINTAQPRVFQNFVYLHELYHLLYYKKEQFHMVSDEIENAIDLNERKANYYASLMLLEKDVLRSNYYYLIKDKRYNLCTTIYHLMNLFKVTYKTILIRLYEIRCIEDFDILYQYFIKYSKHEIYDEFKKNRLDTGILEANNTISICNLEKYIEYARENNAMLEDLININEKEYIRLMSEIKNIQEL
jgi:Zn-dependent peptidase ImmA (M78 family)